MKKSVIRRVALAVIMLIIGYWLIDHSGGQVYGAFIGVTFFLMAVSCIIDEEYVVKFGST